MTKHIILTADDFGYNSAVSQAILDLVKQQRLSATSCMTNIPGWDEHLAELLNYKEHCNIGLHFNLTEGCLLSTGKPAYTLNSLIIQSYLRQLNQTLIETELQAQIDEFKIKTGFLPAYIDGHQHIQQLPIIRKALVSVINKQWPTDKPYVRISSNGLLKSLLKPKALVLHLLGAAPLKTLCKNHRIPFNPSFSGIYNLQPGQNYPQLFEYFLNEIEDKGILMCHPGAASGLSSNDPIYEARVTEYQFFGSHEFQKLLSQYNTQLLPVRDDCARVKV